MRQFAEMFQRLDETNKTNAKVEAMVEYFRTAPAGDCAWALAFLSGRRPKSLIRRATIKEAAMEASGLPEWLYDECYSAVGDSAETIARILPPPTLESEEGTLAEWVEKRVLGLGGLDDTDQRLLLLDSWHRLQADHRFVYNKLITGAFRVGVSRELVVRATAQALEQKRAIIAHRLMGDWEATPKFWESLSDPEDREVGQSQPYPFCLAHPLEDPADLGDPTEWLAEWKWDGIRCQLIRRGGEIYLWSRGEDMIHDAFPDVLALGERLPDGTVLDGEIMAWREGPLPFAELQRRIGRKKPGKKVLEEVPCELIAFDLLEWQGEDWRERPLAERRAQLESLGILTSPRVPFLSVEELTRMREQAREERAEGLMLKRLDSPYEGGRRRGLWWKWKVDPHSVDAVLIYAMRGSGRRASLYTDYTFGVWEGGELVPFAKAYSGLTDEEIRKVDNFVRRNTIEKFGPVRTVKPELVFEIAFEGIQLSKRHKSGVAVRFPRMARWRTDKKPKDADTLDAVKALIGE